ncbi:hypothetical protein PHMEG_00012856 [Phytophthora megakarya]|uniref:Uncharacterized protein n=1 Tax=Phytophthora megakarya TaxID=4795 RepID=A0A225W8P4_9STRA|nr:hypothetical protein PHMEG_00012856 [Phytophthora megakarya]
MEAGKVDLQEKYCRQDIKLHDVFQTAPENTDFLRAHVFNKNKSIVKSNYSTSLSKWKSLTKKRPTKRADTKLSFCPTDANALIKDLSSARARMASYVKHLIMKNEDNNDDKIPIFIQYFARGSPGSTVSSQLGNQGRFYKDFQANGSIIAAQDNLVPVLLRAFPYEGSFTQVRPGSTQVPVALGALVPI